MATTSLAAGGLFSSVSIARGGRNQTIFDRATPLRRLQTELSIYLSLSLSPRNPMREGERGGGRFLKWVWKNAGREIGEGFWKRLIGKVKIYAGVRKNKVS